MRVHILVCVLLRSCDCVREPDAPLCNRSSPAPCSAIGVQGESGASDRAPPSPPPPPAPAAGRPRAQARGGAWMEVRLDAKVPGTLLLRDEGSGAVYYITNSNVQQARAGVSRVRALVCVRVWLRWCRRIQGGSVGSTAKLPRTRVAPRPYLAAARCGPRRRRAAPPAPLSYERPVRAGAPGLTPFDPV
jgi:hypothetical protein